MGHGEVGRFSRRQGHKDMTWDFVFLGLVVISFIAAFTTLRWGRDTKTNAAGEESWNFPIREEGYRPDIIFRLRLARAAVRR
jgi:hypothetical protein